MLSKDLLNLLTTQVLCHKLTLGRVQEVCGDGVNIEVLSNAPLTLCVGTPHIYPTHVVLLDEILPALLCAILVERYAIDLETLRSELLVCCNKVRNLATARTAPCSPEVYQYPLTALAQLCYADDVTLSIGKLQILKFCANGFAAFSTYLTCSL